MWQLFHAAKFLVVLSYDSAKDAHNACPEQLRHSWSGLLCSWCSKEELGLDQNMHCP